MTTPLVSVIVPTYKRVEECIRAVRSILIQTFGNFEIIVGDDCGDDETEAKLKALSDPRIRYFKNGSEGGSACRNRNLCLGHAEGKFITFLDSDDFMLPDRLEKQVAALEAGGPSIGFVISSTRVIRGYKNQYHFVNDLVPTAEGDLKTAYLSRKLKCYNTSMMVYREVLFAVGLWDYSMEPYDDAELIWRLMNHTHAARVKDILTIWIDHDGDSLTNDLEKRMTGLEAFLKKHSASLECEPSWWNPRVQELLKWMFLGANREGFRVWESRLRGPLTTQTKLLRLLAYSPFMFSLASKLLQKYKCISFCRNVTKETDELGNLMPGEHRKEICQVL